MAHPFVGHTTREGGEKRQSFPRGLPTRGHDVDQVIVEPSGVEYVEMARCGPGVVERPSVNRLGRGLKPDSQRHAKGELLPVIAVK